ncbi:MAG TPA: type IVB secretion system protein IcmH/DotU [Stellaceae bacterium]|nr:type IVB secretion system protein IcmH/DotU [Stellaceae bacterium]
MSDNPFSEPDDSERTVIRPAPGGRRAAPAPSAPAPAAAPNPALEPRSSGPLPDGTAGGMAVGLSPLVAAAVPLLQLLARLRNTLNQPDPGDLRERAVAAIREFESRARDTGVSLELLRPAHYALCASLDDVVLNTPWGSTGIWDARSLVSTFHQEVRGGERFFNLLRQMCQNPGTFLPVIELMYLCMSLGFQGQYRLSARGPAELDRLREEIYALLVRQRQQIEPELSPHWQGVAAPYRSSRPIVPLWVVASVALAVLAGLFIWFTTSLNASSDDLFARMLRAPPDHMPQIARAPVAVPAPPTPVLPPPVDDLCTLLKPEVDQGLVTVICTPPTIIIRINNRGMFASGSATVETKFAPLLARIGAGLEKEQGSVQVIGYTDNQPIHTIQFPSNFQLSSARADAAKAILAAQMSDPSRIAAEGRGEADPLNKNSTPEEREENRRIEIVLQRSE